MKVQINAGALVGACDRAISKLESTINDYPKPPPAKELRWWDFLFLAPIAPPLMPDWNLFSLHQQLKQARTFKAIAKHKNPNTILEITDTEIEGIAPYLSEFHDPNGRIE